MSHFSLMVRLPAKTLEEEIPSSVRKLLLSYCESEDEFDTPEEAARYFVFKDVEDEYRHQYETDVFKAIRLASGELFHTFDERFRGPGFLSGFEYPDDSVAVDCTPPEMYPTFEDYMNRYAGYESRHQPQNRYGHLRNPNKKWDWYEIGGRWGNFFHLPSGDANQARIDLLDLDEIICGAAARAKEVHAEYESLLRGDLDEDAADDLRSRLLAFGVIRVADSASEATADDVAMSWPNEERFDLVRRVSADFFTLRSSSFLTIKPYAYLDADGWREPGQMVMFGMSSATVDDQDRYNQSFLPWLLGGDQQDWVVIVDCHI